MRGKQTTGPYYSLGQELRSLRTRANESLADTSGAVEIDSVQLAQYESGQTRPTEELLLLLISHFAPLDTEALRLWKLAGYSLKSADIVEDAIGEEPLAAFTDFMEVSANPNGLILEFKQSSGTKFKSVARLGMSREHAQNVIQALMVALTKSNGANQRLLLPRQADKNKKQ